MSSVNSVLIFIKFAY